MLSLQPILADWTPPAEIAGWLACLGFVLWIVNLAMKLMDRMKDKPHPGDVQREAADKYALKKEFEEQRAHCVKRHSEIFAAIDRVEHGTADKTETKIETIRKEVVGIAREVSEVQAETKLQSQQLSRLDAKLDRIIENKLT